MRIKKHPLKHSSSDIEVGNIWISRQSQTAVLFISRSRCVPIEGAGSSMGWVTTKGKKGLWSIVLEIASREVPSLPCLQIQVLIHLEGPEKSVKIWRLFRVNSNSAWEAGPHQIFRIDLWCSISASRAVPGYCHVPSLHEPVTLTCNMDVIHWAMMSGEIAYA